MKNKMRRYIALFVLVLCMASFCAFADPGSNSTVLPLVTDLPAGSNTSQPTTQVTPAPTTVVTTASTPVTQQNITPDSTTNTTPTQPTTEVTTPPTSPAPTPIPLTTSPPTAGPTSTASATPTVEPTSPVPTTSTPTVEPTAIVSATPTQNSTVQPSSTQTIEPTPTTTIAPPGAKSASIQSAPSAYGPSNTYSSDEIIVRFKPQITADTKNKGRTMTRAHTAVSATVVKDYDQKGLSGMQVVKLKGGKNIDAAIAEYENNPDVLYAVPNYKINLFATPNDPSFSQQWALSKISAPQAWDQATGSNTVVIAVLDTGVDYTHPDLAGNTWTNTKEVTGNSIDDDNNGYIDDVRGWNFVDKNNNPMDTNGHGTACAGIAGAIGNNNLGIAGMDWSVRVLPLKVIGSMGYGYESDAIDAILYANQQGADVISISWGGTGFDQAMKDVIDASPALVVCAAGNSAQNNDNTPVYPASYASANIISVAASDQDDNLASFSNYGTVSVDLAAPGVDIYSTKPGPLYGPASGTSMAVPYVAGVAGLVQAGHPDWTATQVRDAILSNTDPKPQLADKVKTGGRLNAYSAVIGTTPVVTPTTPVPTTVVPTVTPTQAPSGTLTGAPINPEFLLFQASSVQTPVDDGSGHQVLLGYRPSPLNLSYMAGQQPAVMSMDSPPAAYDLRTYNRATTVKNQGSCGSCWAHGAYGSLESSLMPTETWDFNEWDLNVNSGFDYGSCNGGTNDMSAAYLARWGGPFTEGQTTPVRKHVQDVIYLPHKGSNLDNGNIKAAILNYGGISASFYWASGYLRTGGYYYPSAVGDNHMITITGWDDNRVVSGAPANGAYLCKNSWGSTWNGDGYFWISYYDKNIGYDDLAVFRDAQPTTTYDTIYQYDPLGWTSSAGYSQTSAWVSNIFTASTTQEIGAVSLFTTGTNTAYEIYVYTGSDSGPVSGMLGSTTTGTLPYAGYHTITITPVPVTSGQKFSVVVKLTTPTVTNQIAMERPWTGYSSAARASAGQSYVSYNGVYWDDITGYWANTNVCVKAFGVTVPVPVAEFNATPLSVVANSAVQFGDMSTGNPASWNWSFGDGTANATVKNPAHTYTSSGLYTVTLTATNSYGSNTKQKVGYITVVEPPGFLSGWSYRKLHTISGSPTGDLTDYQVRFMIYNTTGTDSGENVYIGQNSKSDYSDVRVTGFDNIPYPIWIHQVNTSAAVVWAKMPSIPSTGTQVYVYYGNGGAQPVSSGDATFALFDHFEGTTLNTTKWTSVNSPTISNSVITLNGAGKSIKSKSQFGTNYAASFYGTLYRDSWHIVGLGNSNSLGAPSSISIVGSYPNTGTYNARNLISGTDTGVNIGNSYSGNHIWTVARNGNQNNQFYVDSDPKATITSGLTTLPLNVMIEEYPTITTGTSVFDWVFVRKYAESGPGQSVWNGQEINKVAPIANFTSDRVTGLGPLSVQFNDTSSGIVTSWQWDFGEGTNSTVQNPVHVYATAGTYTVTLTATNSYGSSTLQKLHYITVTPPPAFLNGWTYRKLHTISGIPSGDLTDYQVRFTLWNTTGIDSGENVYVGSNVKPDYSDIRVTGLDNIAYPIWIQQVNSTAAVVWVKVPSIPSTGTQVYLYYGNGGASAVSSGDATFALFDHFEGTTLNTTKWTSVNSPAIGNSAITLNGAGKLIKSTSQFGTNYAVSVYGTLYRDSWHIVGLGNSNSLGASSSISIVGSYPNTGTYNARNLISGTGTGVNIGNSYSGNHVWTVARNGNQNNQFYVDSDLKTTIISGLTTLPLNVMIEEYQTITTGISVFDWVFVRKYAGSEPEQGVWNNQEINTIAPCVNFTSDKVTGMGPLSVQFNDMSSGISTSWQWQFGDGSSNSTERNPVHVYSNSGTYSVTLTSTNTYGSSTKQEVNYITVTPPPAFLNGWQYRKLHTISGSPSGDQTDYQVRFTVWNTTGTDNGENVYIGQNSKSDYSDVRVTGLDNISYPIWIQQVNTSAAVVWAKIPSIPSTGTQVYVYYGNGGAQPVSSGDATFALFDHFEGTTVNPNKWTSVNSPTISNSAITLNGAGKLIKSTSQFGTNYAVSFYGTLYRDSWHIVGLGNSNSLGAASSISLVGSYPNAGTYNARNLISGADSGVNIGNSYSGNHIWTVARNGDQNNQFYVDSDPKATITSGLTTLPLNVMIEEYPTITTGISVFDWVFVRKYAGSEPEQGVWNNQEINTIAPGVNFTSDKVTGMGPLSVQFNDTSSGISTSWQWQFGDGSSNSTERNPVHVYSNSGTYSVTLTSTNTYGSSTKQEVNYITVTPPPAFLNGWQYRKLHTIAGSSSGDLTDYQVRFTVWNTTGTDNGENVYIGQNSKSDYSDVRVTGFDNIPYPIWIQQVNTTAAVVWAKIPSIPSTGTQVYVYYGNGGAQPVSSGDATFALFDHFEGTTVNPNKWTSVNSPTISNSAITLNGAGKLIKSTSQFGTNYAVSFYGTLYRDTWHIVGLGNSNSLGAASSISLVGSYPNAGTYNARNLISGTDTGVNIGNSYSGNHIWTVARNGDQNNQFYVDSDPKATITSGLTTLPLNVMIEEYPTITTGTSVFDWVFVRKYAESGPGQGVWNCQEINFV